MIQSAVGMRMQQDMFNAKMGEKPELVPVTMPDGRVLNVPAVKVFEAAVEAQKGEGKRVGVNIGGMDLEVSPDTLFKEAVRQLEERYDVPVPGVGVVKATADQIFRERRADTSIAATDKRAEQSRIAQAVDKVRSGTTYKLLSGLKDKTTPIAKRYAKSYFNEITAAIAAAVGGEVEFGVDATTGVTGWYQKMPDGSMRLLQDASLLEVTK